MVSTVKIKISAAFLFCAVVVSLSGIKEVLSEEVRIVPPKRIRPTPTPRPEEAAQPTPAPMPKEGELKCEVAMQRLLQASDYGPSLSGLKPGVAVQSFKVADVKQGMKIAQEAIAKIPNATPEQQKAIDQGNALRSQYDDALGKHRAALAKLKELQADRATIENLVFRPEDLAVTRSEIEKKVQAASALVRSTNELVEQKQKVFLDFVEKNGLTFSKTGSPFDLVPKKSFKTEMSDAVALGDVADAAKRIDYIERSRIESGLPIPFDEILVVRGQSLAERKAVIDQYKDLLPDLREIQTLEIYVDRLAQVLVTTSLSPASKGEIEQLIKKAELRLGKLDEKNPEQMRAQLRAKLENERPLTILKSGGVIVAAIADGDRHTLSLDPVTYRSKGFWCRDAKTVSGGWHHSRGVISIEKCKSEYEANVFDSSCRNAMNFNYQGPAGPPRPTKSPTQAPGVAR